MSQDSGSETKIAGIGKDSAAAFHYRLFEVDDDGKPGECVETTFDDDPAAYLHGHGNIVRGLEQALAGRVVGDQFSITITPEEGYGPRNEDAVRRVPSKHVYEFKKGKTFRPGQVVTVETKQGARQVVVVKAGKFNLDVDFNHPLAGKTLAYEIKVVDVRMASAEEISHGHVHGPGGHHH